MTTFRVLGCSGAIAAGDRTTSFLVDGGLLLDAGSGVGDLTLAEMIAVDDIVLTHSHLDHVLGIPLMADSTQRARRAAGRGPIRVHGLAPTLEALRLHLFNGVIWPDFTRLPSEDAPVLTLHPFEIGQTLALPGGLAVEVLPARHTVPACGLALKLAGGDFVFTGDTAPEPALWRQLAGRPLQGLVIEAAFRDEDAVLAGLSGHLRPRTLVDELAQVAADVPVWLTHVKPGDLPVVEREIAAHGPRQRVVPLRAGQVIELG